ncbi:empty spiracles homeobox 3 [Neoarius graeffei]|uniref:empty spiracles homeobox 3 n=1 Tax=Neoarius graeffei TaxID=443677 RepID=UPI00298C02F5|nr:empty spiracles homeobox 3 [Neoarius graeffei]
MALNAPISRNPFKIQSLTEWKRNSLMLGFKSARAFPPCLHSAHSPSGRTMDTPCFRATAHFPPRPQPKSFSIDWILSSGHRKPALDSQTVCTPPQLIMRGALFPARPFGFGFEPGACVYTSHFYHRQNAAYRNTNDAHQSVGLTCNTGDFGLKTCRRIRTVFSAEQLQKLEEVFAKQRYMTGSEKVVLASALRLTETQVKVWFQNRRTKWRKSRELEERSKHQCSDLKHETSMTENAGVQSVDSEESSET